MYPSGIPGPCMPYSGQYVENIQRTQMEGDIRQRRKFTATQIDFALTFKFFDKTQYQAFLAWYEGNDNGSVYDDMQLLVAGELTTVPVVFLAPIIFDYDKKLNITTVQARVRSRV